MMMARYPVMMASWSGALPTVVDTVWRALADALPERIPAAHSGSLGATFVFFGYDPRRERRFVVQSIESGGWGDPLERDPALVLSDVHEGYVSVAAARDEYGVVVTPDLGSVDLEATVSLRSILRRQ